MRIAWPWILVVACSSNAPSRPVTLPPAPDAGVVVDAPEVAVAPAPDAAPPTPCFVDAPPYQIGLVGADTEVCWGAPAQCLLVAEDGSVTGPAARIVTDDDPWSIEVTVKDAHTVEVCPTPETCRTLKPKLKRAHSVTSAQADAAGAHVMMTIIGGDMGDDSSIEIWSLAAGKRVASLELPWSDEEAAASWAEWVGSLVLIIEEDAPERDVEGTLYKIGKSKLEKVGRLSDVVGWFAVGDAAVFGTNLGSAIEVRELATGKLRKTHDATWLVADDDREGLAFGGLVKMAAAGDRAATFVADAPRIGVITLSTSAHVRVDLPSCP